MYLIDTTLFKTLVCIEATRIFPFHKKGRPPKLTNEEAFDCILKVVRTGMHWRILQPQSTSYITVFKRMHAWIRAKKYSKTAYTRLLHLY